jgi:hypothetical protein
MIDDVLLPDMHPLTTLERKLQLVRDLTTAVAKGFKTGLYLYRQGGVGKSFTVLHHLEFLEAPVILYNARMTGKGLFQSLQHAPDAIHVLEDMERLTKDADAQGVLRSALWAQPGLDRVVTWTTATDGKLEVNFRGGLILISNRPLADMPELRALATRIEVHRLEVSEMELVALMRELASKGFCHRDKHLLGPEECLEVTEHLLKECRSAGCPLDLRLQQKCFRTYLQWDQKWAHSHSRDLVASSVREATHNFNHESDTLPREDRLTRSRNILRAIIAEEDDTKEQQRLYREQTGYSRADFFRRKREVETGDFDEQDAA